MQIKGRTLQLNEGRLSTSDVLYKKPPLDEPNSDEKTQEISIVEETNAEIDATE